MKLILRVDPMSQLRPLMKIGAVTSNPWVGVKATFTFEAPRLNSIEEIARSFAFGSGHVDLLDANWYQRSIRRTNGSNVPAPRVRCSSIRTTVEGIAYV